MDLLTSCNQASPPALGGPGRCREVGHGARNFRHSAGFLQNSSSRGQVGCSVGGPVFENVGGPGSITEEGPGSVYGEGLSSAHMRGLVSACVGGPVPECVGGPGLVLGVPGV